MFKRRKFSGRAFVVFLCFILMAVDVLSTNTLSKVSLGGWCYNIVHILSWGFLLSALMFFLGRWSRVVYVPLLLFLLFNGIAETYVRAKFGVNYYGDWILVLQASSPSELYAFFVNNLVALIGCSLGLACAALLLVRIVRRADYPVFSIRSALIGFLFLLPMFVMLVKTQSVKKAFEGAVFHRVVSDTAEQFWVFNDLGKVHCKPEGIENVRLSTPLSSAPTCVIVIGESATRNNFGIYGYERDTTPLLGSLKDDLCVFKDLVGVWYNTPQSIRFLFTGATATDKSHAKMMISQVAAKAGYPQTFISNQARWGRMNNTITYIFDSSEKQIYIQEKGDSGAFYDEMMLPHFKSAVTNSCEKGQVIYLHMSGSHYPFKGVYPDSWRVFKGDKPIDHYDNTICYTDYVLHEIIKTLKDQAGRPSFLFFVSDHGDTPRSTNFRYFDDMDLWELPLFIWFSDSYKQMFPKTVNRVVASSEKPLQSDQILPGLLEIMQIVGCDNDGFGGNFLCPDFVPRTSRYIKNWTTPYESTRQTK